MGTNVVNARVIDGGSLAYLEHITVEQADGLHTMYGVEFEMNDGRLIGIRRTEIRCGMDCGATGADRSALLPAAL